MPTPYFDLTIIPRPKGRSLVATAAYRAGEKLDDDRLGKTLDYTHKEKVVLQKNKTVEDVPAWAIEREALWNQIETAKVSDTKVNNEHADSSTTLQA